MEVLSRYENGEILELTVWMVVEVHAFKAHMWKSKDKVIESAMWALGVELR